ncbi:tRNA1(Val) (adenine(37)-N6)-methyltransferase [Flavobacterium sp. N2270]|uniref:tRNA1(Val) (adenine(37)-N6)-methyltransferase n=1 Tax=Flavobacterium sp. N2270 TaxID=2986831 RepID=UPI002225603A|nr:methyltransferase [Flavobacterium sp. N2270]
MSFYFKQFTIHQDRCAMKIGTDAVLLGAWSPIPKNIFSVLDIGSGTGVLSLMLAQRTLAEQIDAIEIDEEAYEQCVQNFENSNWGDRLFCYHAGLDEFVQEMEDESYDLIISNPPFYTDEYKSDTEKRNVARFQDALPFEELIDSAANLLNEFGVFSVIIPCKEEEKFIQIAKQFHLHPFKITRVKGTPNSELKRSLLAFTWDEQITIEDELIIEVTRHQYTQEYIQLTKEFYLKL